MKKKKTLCLVMIVKNESKVIQRCLNRVKDHIDYWVIVDTGSDDNTPELIEQTLSDIPGELHHQEWVNFGMNRTRSLQLAKGKADYILLCDADEQLLFSDDFDANNLDKSAYLLEYVGNYSYAVPYLLSNALDWKYVGVTHEYLDAAQPFEQVKLTTIKILDSKDGGAKSDKYERDIRLLEQGVIDEPNNSRYKFYLANSYRDTEQYEKAIEWYKKRIIDGGWKEEVTVAYENLGFCYQMIGKNKEALYYWLEGYNENPARLECLFSAIRLLRLEKKYQLAYQLCLIGIKIPYPKNDILFVQNAMYDYLLHYEASLCAYYVKDFKLGYDCCKHILLQDQADDEITKIVLNNLYFYKEYAGSDTQYHLKSLIQIISDYIQRTESKEVGHNETLRYLKALV